MFAAEAIISEDGVGVVRSSDQERVFHSSSFETWVAGIPRGWSRIPRFRQLRHFRGHGVDLEHEGWEDM